MAIIFLFLIFQLILPTYQNTAPPKFLHVHYDESENVRRPTIINNPAEWDSQQHQQLHRHKRDSSGNFANDNDNLKNNIITKVRKYKKKIYKASAINTQIISNIDKCLDKGVKCLIWCIFPFFP